jgi:hypothetical protein
VAFGLVRNGGALGLIPVSPAISVVEWLLIAGTSQKQSVLLTEMQTSETIETTPKVK